MHLVWVSGIRILDPQHVLVPDRGVPALRHGKGHRVALDVPGKGSRELERAGRELDRGHRVAVGSLDLTDLR